MPARTDHDVRRREAAEAVWRVLARDGFAALSLRAVAAEMGATTGLVTHYFGGRAELVDHALVLLHERTDATLGDTEAPLGLGSLRSRLLAVLPTTDDGAELSRIWVGFWGPALSDPGLTDREAARYERWREWLRPHVRAAQAAGELGGADDETVVDLLTTVTHGLVVQALFDPDRFPPGRQAVLLDAQLAALRRDITHA